MLKWREDVISWEDYVVGKANADAYHVARKFIQPSCDGNILFVTGNIGSGKTYLIKAVEMEFLTQNQSVKRVNSDQFVGELIWHLSKNKEDNAAKTFCAEYETYDVLLLDDIHFLEGKESTQKYFAYLLSQFSKHQKKVMITSVKELSEYKWLQETMSSYEIVMEQVQIQDADVELKEKIVEKLQEKWGYELSEESRKLIVENAKDIRQLEGMFKKIMAYAQLMGNVELTDN